MLRLARSRRPGSWLLVALTALLAPLASAEERAAEPARLPGLLRVEPAPPAHVGPGVVEVVGQIVVMQGDDEIVSDLGGGDYGIDPATQMPAIGERFYMHLPDEFDGIAVFTTFPDRAQTGLAYSVSAGWSGVDGLGLDGTGSGAGAYGSAGRLISVINMNDTATYGAMDESDTFFVSVFGQEFAHTWLSFMRFVDPVSGTESSELLGRDGSHWSANFHSGSSVMDGLSYTQSGQTFVAGDYASRYGPLDLYAMGVIGPDEVEGLFLIRNAVYQQSGQPVDPINDGWTGRISPGTVLTGQRVDISIDDIVAAHGPRVPAWDEENEDFRVAFVLVTRPDETVDDVAAHVAKLETGRRSWELAHQRWTDDRSTMCTDVTALCPLSAARIDGAVVREGDDADGDGVLEPGEPLVLDLTVTNTGGLDAESTTLLLASESAGVRLPTDLALPTVPAGESISHGVEFEIDGAACGEAVTVTATSQILHRTWRGAASFRPGVLEDAAIESFASAAGWDVNVDNRDTTVTGAFAHGVPEATYFAGRLLQPDGCAGGAADGCWFTAPLDRWDEGEVMGQTTLYSTSYDLSDRFRPILRYSLWYLALDRTLTQLTPSAGAHLVVEASVDAGATWVEIDRVDGAPRRWEVREAPLDALEAGADVRFRFRVTDDKDPTERLVEIGIDDVAVVSLSDECASVQDGGCCAVTPGAAPSSLALTGLVALLLMRRRRTRARR